MSKAKGKNKLTKEALTELLELIRENYLADSRPWVIGYSGGKDSSCVLQLTWQAISKLPVEKKVSTYELRENYIHAHALALQALAIAGAALIAAYPNDWEKRLANIKGIDWSKENSELWEGRAMIGGQINKSLNCQILTANVIKKHLKLSLDSREQETEDLYAKGKRKK